MIVGIPQKLEVYLIYVYLASKTFGLWVQFVNVWQFIKK